MYKIEIDTAKLELIILYLKTVNKKTRNYVAFRNIKSIRIKTSRGLSTVEMIDAKDQPLSLLNLSSIKGVRIYNKDGDDVLRPIKNIKSSDFVNVIANALNSIEIGFYKILPDGTKSYRVKR